MRKSCNLVLVFLTLLTLALAGCGGGSGGDAVSNGTLNPSEDSSGGTNPGTEPGTGPGTTVDLQAAFPWIAMSPGEPFCPTVEKPQSWRQ